MKNSKRYRMLVVGLSRNRGGVESYVLNMARSFSSECIELCFPSNGAEETYGEELRALGHRFIHTPKGRGRHFLAYYRAWDCIFRQYRFDVVYVNDCSVVQIDLLRLAKQHHVPVRIFHAHSSSWTQKPALHHRLLAAWNKGRIADIATKLLACSQRAAEWMFPPTAPCEVMTNAIDVEQHTWSAEAAQSFRSELGVGAAPLVGYIGHLLPVKNPVHFVRTFAVLRRTVPNAIALMTGSGSLLPDVKAVIHEYGLTESSFRLLGERRDISRMMSALDCLVMPSLSEGFPFVLVEAQAHGLPCVVSDCVAHCTNLTGLVDFVSLDNVDAWVTAITQTFHVSPDRTIYAQRMRELGYDTKTVFARLQATILADIERLSLREGVN